MSEPTPFSLKGRHAIVTGGSRGIGFAIARGLIAAGARVALVARNAAELDEARRRLGADAVALPFDVAGAAPFSALVDLAEEALGGHLDVVVHGAGIQHRAAAASFPPLEWQRILAVNLTAPFELSQEIGRRQLDAGRNGSHIFIGSLTSLLSVEGIVAYTASKSAVYGVVRSLSTEWSAHGIRVNAIGPGYVHTELTAALFDDPHRRRRLEERIPMGRFGTPDDMAAPAVFLASDASAYVTGQLLMVDGGWTAQ